MKKKICSNFAKYPSKLAKCIEGYNIFFHIVMWSVQIRIIRITQDQILICTNWSVIRILMNRWSASHGLTNKNDCYDWMNDLQSAAIRIFFERIIRITQKSGFWTDNPDVDQRIIPLTWGQCCHGTQTRTADSPGRDVRDMSAQNFFCPEHSANQHVITNQ